MPLNESWLTGYSRSINGTTENAGLENTRPSYRAGMENAKPVAMERRWYQCCKTEMDVVVRCRKHTRTGNILYAVINSYRKKYTLLTQSELKYLRKIRMHQKSAKTHHSVKIANALPWCTLAFNMATMPPYTVLISAP